MKSKSASYFLHAKTSVLEAAQAMDIFAMKTLQRQMEIYFQWVYCKHSVVFNW